MVTSQNVELSKVDQFFDGLPSNPNVTTGKHWSGTYKEKQEWQKLVRLMTYNQRPPKPWDRARVHIHFSVGDNRAHDLDNLIASMKAPIDGLKGHIIVDDSIDHIELTFSADRNKPRGFRITVYPI